MIEDKKKKKVEDDSNEKCPVCGAKLIHREGCLECPKCGWGACDV